MTAILLLLLLASSLTAIRNLGSAEDAAGAPADGGGRDGLRVVVRLLGVATFVGFGLVCWWVYQVGPGRSGVVVAGTASDGREYCVVQTFKGWTEPYQVSLYVRDESDAWRWRYLEHEALAWRSAQVELVEGRAVVYRDGERFAELELDDDSAPEPLGAELTAADVARAHDLRYGF